MKLLEALIEVLNAADKAPETKKLGESSNEKKNYR